MFNAKELILNTNVEVKGKELNSKMIAYSVTFNSNQLVQLRNNEGLPLWAGAMVRNNRPRISLNDMKKKMEYYMNQKMQYYMKNYKGQQRPQPYYKK
jgi:hypothetical protein